MKIIALTPVRNEAWILPSFLQNLSEFCDQIILADQKSSDGSAKIIKNFSKVRIIENKEEGHSNKVRWKLLDAARETKGKNLILYIDADEMIPPKLFRDFLKKTRKTKLSPGTWLEFNWVQLWKSPWKYRNDDSIWSGIWKPIGFIDDRKIEFNRGKIVINDHTSRVPGTQHNQSIRVEGVPVLHFQWVDWERSQVKQAWYRCSELIKRPKEALRINARYGITLDEPEAKLSDVPREWLDGLTLPDFKSDKSNWQKKEILKWFEQYGVEFFEPLEIWHIQELKDEFVKMTKRGPRSHWLSPPIRLLRKIGWKLKKKL